MYPLIGNYHKSVHRAPATEKSCSVQLFLILLSISVVFPSSSSICVTAVYLVHEPLSHITPALENYSLMYGDIGSLQCDVHVPGHSRVMERSSRSEMPGFLHASLNWKQWLLLLGLLKNIRALQTESGLSFIIKEFYLWDCPKTTFGRLLESHSFGFGSARINLISSFCSISA